MMIRVWWWWWWSGYDDDDDDQGMMMIRVWWWWWSGYDDDDQGYDQTVSRSSLRSLQNPRSQLGDWSLHWGQGCSFHHSLTEEQANCLLSPVSSSLSRPNISTGMKIPEMFVKLDSLLGQKLFNFGAIAEKVLPISELKKCNVKNSGPSYLAKVHPVETSWLHYWCVQNPEPTSWSDC